MIELHKKCKCGELVLSTHQSETEPDIDDIVYGYCECGKELSSLISDCNVYEDKED
jgi:hypothetical protein